MTIKAYRGPRFNDDVLVVGLDMAKRRHVAVAEALGRFSKPLPVDNDWASFEKLEDWARKEMARHGCTSVVFAMESTSHYHKPLEEWLLRRGHTVRFVSTFATSRAKEMLDGSPLKNDEKDACVVADLARQGKSLPLARHDERYTELRHLSEFRQRLTEEKTQCLNRLHRVLDQGFPELPGLFGELEGRACRALLATAPLPDGVVRLGLEALSEPPGFTGNAPGGPSRWSTDRSGDWQPLRPELVAEVRYDHVTGNRFRHGTKFLRWRPDKAPEQCRMDQLEPEARPAQLATSLEGAS